MHAARATIGTQVIIHPVYSIPFNFENPVFLYNRLSENRSSKSIRIIPLPQIANYFEVAKTFWRKILRASLTSKQLNRMTKHKGHRWHTLQHHRSQFGRFFLSALVPIILQMDVCDRMKHFVCHNITALVANHRKSNRLAEREQNTFERPTQRYLY